MDLIEKIKELPNELSASIVKRAVFESDNEYFYRILNRKYKVIYQRLVKLMDKGVIRPVNFDKLSLPREIERDPRVDYRDLNRFVDEEEYQCKRHFEFGCLRTLTFIAYGRYWLDLTLDKLMAENVHLVITDRLIYISDHKLLEYHEAFSLPQRYWDTELTGDKILIFELPPEYCNFYIAGHRDEWNKREWSFIGALNQKFKGTIEDLLRLMNPFTANIEIPEVSEGSIGTIHSSIFKINNDIYYLYWVSHIF